MRKKKKEVKKKVTISKNIVKGILSGLVTGAILFLIAIAINTSLGIWVASANVVFFIIGFAAMVGKAYVVEKEAKNKDLIGGVLNGFVFGALLYLIAVAINASLGIWAFHVEIVFFIIGFAATVGEAYLGEDDE